jgi:hypothetical protein
VATGWAGAAGWQAPKIIAATSSKLNKVIKRLDCILFFSFACERTGDVRVE